MTEVSNWFLGHRALDSEQRNSVMHNIDVIVWFFVIAILMAGVAVSAVLIGTIRRRGKFGINFDLPNCPGCGEQVSAIRAPRSLKQFVWGGFACKCGCEIDKWGKELLRKGA